MRKSISTLFKDKRGDFTGVLYMIVMLTVTAIFILIVGHIVLRVTPEIKNQLNTSRTEINESLDTTSNVGTNTLSVIWFITFLGLLLGILVTSWKIQSQPIFIPIFIILLVVAVIVGYALSEAYTKIYNVADFATVSSSQQIVFFLMTNLEYLALIIGLISLIVTFAKPGGGDAGGAPIM